MLADSGLRRLFSLVVLCALGGASAVVAARSRDAIPAKYKWDLTHIYPTEAAFERDLAGAEGDLEKLKICKEKITLSPENLLGCFEQAIRLHEKVHRVLLFAQSRASLDMGDVAAREQVKRSLSLDAAYQGIWVFLQSKISQLAPDGIEAWCKKEKRLRPYRHALLRLAARRNHLLDAASEEMLDRYAKKARTVWDVYGTLYSALAFPKIKEGAGEVEVGPAMFSKLRSSADRSTRKATFVGFLGAFRDARGEFAGLLDATVASHIQIAKKHRYASALESAMANSEMPVEAFRNNTRQVFGSRKLLWRYLALRRRLLGLDRLEYSDLYAPAAQKTSFRMEFEPAKDTLLEALAPLGEDYARTLKEAFDGRWIDVFPTDSKRGGAYSAGLSTEVHPFVLLNYQDDIQSLKSAAHEIGHALHSYYSARNQPPHQQEYKLTLTEVASNVNEFLLVRYLIEHSSDRDLKIELLTSFLESFRQTVFRQTQFAQVELELHEAAEAGEILTADRIERTYLKALREYYGHAEGVCQVDPIYAIEWAYVPHFHYDFYTYQYTTAYVAALALGQRLLDGDLTARDGLLTLLKAGDSDYPLNLLKKAGADLTRPDVYHAAFKAYEQAIDDLERLTRT